MTRWSFVFFIVAIAAGALGFGDPGAVGIESAAKVLFFVFFAVSVVTLFVGLTIVPEIEEAD